MNGHAPFARGPTKGRGVRLDRIPRPGAATRLCLDPRPSRGSLHHLSRSKLSSLPPLSGRRALQGGELDAPIMEQRETSRPVGRFDRITQPPARLTNRLCARSLWSRLQPASASPGPSQGRASARLDNRAARKRSQPDRAETGPLDRLLRPRKGWLGTRRAAREKPQRRGRGPGSGRRPVPAGRSVERGPGQRTGGG